MSKKYEIGDMLIAIGRSKEFDDLFCRVFLYLFVKIVENQEAEYKITTADNKLVQYATLDPKDAAFDLGLSIEEYEGALLLMTDRKLIIRKPVEASQEFVALNPDSGQWILDRACLSNWNDEILKTS